MRITPQMMLSQYKHDVGDSYASMAKAMRHAYDYRAFDLPSDDPLAAAQTFQIHSQMDDNNDYASNISNVKGEMASGDQILINIDSDLTTASTDISAGKNGTTDATGRGTYGSNLLDIRDRIISQLNTKYADSYVFSGSGDGTPPFELVKDPGGDSSKDKLYYRGVNVDTGWTKAEDSGSDPAPAAAVASKRLTDLSNDPVYVDIGLGMAIDPSTGKINPQTAYNRSMPGISYIGCGKDVNGIPQNICSQLSQIASILNKSQSENQLTDSELDTINKYANAFDTAHNKCQAGQSGTGNRLQFLTSESSYISTAGTSLADKDNSVEYISPYDAIETFYSQMYCYNASLKVGSQILQQSLMDYLK